jgi:hypothetical protein
MKLRVLAVSFMVAVVGFPAVAVDALEQLWRNPPREARPMVWWHWVNGYVTKEGITADLEAMKRIGLGGCQMFDGDLGVKIEGLKSVPWMSPEWLDLVGHAASESKRLGLEFGMAICPGWSECGAPWVASSNGMQRLVWSESVVEGPASFSSQPAALPSGFGPFQNQPVQDSARKTLEELKSRPFARDLRVLAYPLPEGAPASKPLILLDGVTNAAVADGDYGTGVTLAGNGVRMVEVRFDTPVTIRALTLGGSRLNVSGKLEASLDGLKFPAGVDLRRLREPGVHDAAPAMSTSFGATTGRVFRFKLAAGKGVKLNEVVLHGERMVSRWQDKVGFGILNTAAAGSVTDPDGDGSLDPKSVLDLTDRLRADGTLNWTVPAGRWVVLHLGIAATGRCNHPARPGSIGLECDKFSARAQEEYLREWEARLWPRVKENFSGLLCDSWEAGVQTWSVGFIEEFRSRRGYDPSPYFPVLAGRVVTTPEISERFLRDVRRTQADLVADHHYGTIQRWHAQRGLTFYAEAPGCGPHFADKLQCKGRVDVPMGEFWVSNDDPTNRFYARHPISVPDCKEAASAGHIYGKRMVGAEAFTAGGNHPAWQQTPATMKTEADFQMALGINRFIFHTFVHQPFVGDRKPGVTFGPFGTHFTRNLTWWDCGGKEWIDYLARCQGMLQQGRFVADILFFLGEDAPTEAYDYFKEMGVMPAGYDYDFCNAEVLLQATMKGGRIVLPSGMEYRVVTIPERIRTLSPELVAKLRELVAGGATLVGLPPVRAPGLAGYPECDIRVQAMAKELWGSAVEPRGGKPGVVWGKGLAEVMVANGVRPDVEFRGVATNAVFTWIHRIAGDRDIYFVANQLPRAEAAEVVFRVHGVPERWDPVTGEIRELPEFKKTGDGRTAIPLEFGPQESCFVVFRAEGALECGGLTPLFEARRDVSQQAERRVEPRLDKALSSQRTPKQNHQEINSVKELAGPWAVQFDPKWGGPEKPVAFEKLEDWSKRSEPGIKYYSGTAVYRKVFDLDVSRLTSHASPLLLSLGTVHDLARIRLNGRDLGVIWCAPWQIKIPDGLLKAEGNQLEIEVVNTWVNRLIRDGTLPVSEQLTWVTANPYAGTKGLPPQLREAGLLGPVQLLGP